MVNLLVAYFYLFWANIFNIIIALLGLRLLVSSHDTKTYLMLTIAILCVIGSYALRNNFFDVYVMFGFGLLGLAMRWLDMLSCRSCSQWSSVGHRGTSSGFSC